MARQGNNTDSGPEFDDVSTKHSGKKWWLIGLLALVLIGVGVAGYLLYHKQSQQKSPSALLQNGLLAQQKGNLTSAISYYNQVIAANPSNEGHYTTYAYYNLGVLYTSQGNNTIALGEYANAVQSDPKYLPALFNLAVLETPTDPSGALATYDKILAIKPHDSNTLFNAGLLHLQLGNKKLAVSMVKEAIKYSPSLASRVPAGFPSLK